MMVFQDYLHLSMEIFLNDFCVFSTIAYHKEKLKLCFNHVTNLAIDNFLSQKNEKSFDHPIYFASR